MTRKSKPKGRARELQKRTGWSYSECLRCVNTMSHEAVEALIALRKQQRPPPLIVVGGQDGSALIVGDVVTQEEILASPALRAAVGEPICRLLEEKTDQHLDGGSWKCTSIGSASVKLVLTRETKEEVAADIGDMDDEEARGNEDGGGWGR